MKIRRANFYRFCLYYVYILIYNTPDINAIDNELPNIIIMVADDLGIGDLGCFGNTSIHTPNIDRIAKEGVKLTHHLAAASLCTPSRAALLTGRYPARFGLVGQENTPPVVVHVASTVGIPKNETTFIQALNSAHYTSAAVGKWHLGSGCELFGKNCKGPLNYGFNSSYYLPLTLMTEFATDERFFLFPIKEQFYQGILITLIISLLMSTYLVKNQYFYTSLFNGILSFLILLIIWFIRTHYRFHTTAWWQVSDWMNLNMNNLLMIDDKVIEQPLKLNGLSQKLINYSLNFIEENKNRHFLLYHSFGHVHTPMFSAEYNQGKSKYGKYGDNIEEMDQGVGLILNKIDDLNLSENTLIYFVSDHGGHLEAIDDFGQRTGGYNGKYKGGKGMGGAEGGIRVPGILRWPGKISPETIIDHPTSLLDVFPTLLDITKLTETSALQNINLDGISFAPLLFNNSMKNLEDERFLIHHCRQNIHAIRYIKGPEVYKIYFVKNKWKDHSTQCGWGENTLCGCYGNDVIDLNLNPEVYDLSVDEFEDFSMNSSDSRYNLILNKTIDFLEDWKIKNMYPTSQFKNIWNVVLSPWLQPHNL